MFSGERLYELTRNNSELLADLQSVEGELNRRFFDSAKPIRALILAIITGEPLLLVGPPGVAKSLLIRTFCRLTGLLPLEQPGDKMAMPQPANYFEYLLTPFTEPGELFGYWDLVEAQRSGKLQRANRGRMMQDARVVYLDEVFNGSSAILNSILSFLNERLFHDTNGVIPVKMECLFGATNQIPESDELRAIFDRFVLRSRLHNVKVDDSGRALRELLSVGWKTTFDGLLKPLPQHGRFWNELPVLRDALGQLDLDGDGAIYGQLNVIVGTARKYQLSEVSNRRLIKFVRVMEAHRIYDGFCRKEDRDHFQRSPVRPQELQLFGDYFLDVIDEPEFEQHVDQLRRLTTNGTAGER